MRVVQATGQPVKGTREGMQIVSPVKGGESCPGIVIRCYRRKADAR
jgi:hypothetical protein